MALIQGGHWSRFLQKYFGVKGEIVAPEVGPEIHPVIPITNLPTEHRFLDGITSWFKEANAVGGAGNPGEWLITNALLSNVQIKIQYLELLYTPSVLGSPLRWIIQGTDSGTYAGGAGGFLLDSRARTVFSVRSVAHCYAFATSAGPGVVNLNPIGQPIAGTTLHVLGGCGRELLLNPGEVLRIHTSANTEAIKGQVWWTERFLDPSEITA